MSTFEENLKDRMKAAEDRWKDAEEEIVKEPEQNLMEGLPEEFQYCIQHPLTEDLVPMVMIAVNNMNYIGGMIEVTDDGRISTFFPMMYFERISQGAVQGAGGRLEVGMVKIYNTLRMLAKYDIRYTGLYILDSRSPQDQEMVRAYEKAVTSAIAGDSGIEIPETSKVVL